MYSRTLSHTARQIRPRLQSGNGLTLDRCQLARLLSSLAVLEQRDGKLSSSSWNAITAAQKLGGSVTGFLAGGDASRLAQEASKITGLQKILAVENPAYDKVSYKNSSIMMLGMD